MMSSRQWTNVCIRITDASTDINEINREIRDRIVKSGNFMISQSNIGNNVILRPVIANPAVNTEQIDNLVAEIVSTGNDILRGIPFSQ